MKKIEIFGEDRWDEYTKLREGCRGILINEGRILLSYYKSVDRYLIPGGGIEEGESLRECCERELAEETGIIVKAKSHYLTLEEYYHEYYFKSHYFFCEYVGECDVKMTDNEIESGLEARWVELDEAIKIFRTYEKYKEIDEVQYGAYYREHMALSEYKKITTD